MPSTSAARSVGSLILGSYEGESLVHVGRVGTGFSNSAARDLWTQLDPLRIKASPFSTDLPPLARRNAKWVDPRLVCEVTFRGWTADDQLRHASFKTLRPDVRPDEVVREATVKRPKPRAAKSQAKSAPVEGVTLTHPDRVLWDDVGLTKEGLAAYYTEIAEHILPHVIDRPLSLVRCPDGVGSCFYQKHGWAGMDDRHLHLVGNGSEQAVVIRDRDGLLALVQASVLEIHPWGATAADADRPDRLVFDLDPGEGVGWSDLVAGALEVRERLERLGFAAFVKTTGGKGLHVVTPLDAEGDLDRGEGLHEARRVRDGEGRTRALRRDRLEAGPRWPHLRGLPAQSAGCDRRFGLLDPCSRGSACVCARQLGRASFARLRRALQRRERAEPPRRVEAGSMG